MNINKFLFQKSWIWLSVFFGFALIAFWPSYYADLAGQETARTHTHGIAMTLWCLMLIAQAYLVRVNRRNIHRVIGKFSYVLVPFVILSTLNLTHYSLKENTPYTDITFSSLALMINATVLFGIIYGLAIYYKNKPLTHARYMFCTIFPMFTPITDRIIYRHAGSLVEIAPTIGDSPIVPFWGFFLALSIVAVLAVWDWKSNQRKDVFPVVFVFLLIYHISVFTLHKVSLWRQFGNWFLGMHLS